MHGRLLDCAMEFTQHPVVVSQAQLSRLALLELQEALQPALTPNLRWLAELDVTCAMAEVSCDKCFVRPNLTDANTLKIIKGVLVHADNSLDVFGYTRIQDHICFYRLASTSSCNGGLLSSK